MVSPKKQYLNMVSVRLGLGGMPNLSALNKILAYVLEGEFHLYFDHDVYGTPVDGSFDQVNDTQVMVCGESSPLHGRKTLVETNLIRAENEYRISLSQFICKGKTYYPVDETGTMIEFRKLNPDSFYCLKNELDTFINNRNGVKGRRKGKTQMKREKALIEYLRHVTQKDDLTPQEYYVAINEPKQETLWDALTNYDSTIFKPNGEEQFFRHQKIIEFPRGTRKYG